MYRFAIIGVLVAALAVPASAAANGLRARRAHAQTACLQALIVPPNRNYSICGSRYLVRDPATGKVHAVPFWRLQQGYGPDRP
jgi:hypothetical protein